MLSKGKNILMYDIYIYVWVFMELRHLLTNGSHTIKYLEKLSIFLSTEEN